MVEQNLYKHVAEYYDLIYSDKDYAGEAHKLKEIIKKYKQSAGKELLEVACGTGHHISHLKSTFNCMGVDVNKGILSVAKKKHKNVEFKQADMTKFNLNKQYDVITCLFSSIGYVRTYAKLKKTINNFAKHLKVGGVVIIEPWFTKEVFIDGLPFMDTYKDDNLALARVSYSKVKNGQSVIQMDYLISEKGKGLKHYTDTHTMGLFGTKKTIDFMEKAGLKTHYNKEGIAGRGLFIGVKK